ncbi:putative P450 monooxygenase [Teratosphaeria nubilosa]|uniref:Putative P450 monooxygenase n=1 Tax=Teratosphaeria nubilosa TaxID=161662 RepID=A0A6G1LIB5_9PEZI|nr:putative P450 monooxygenase [Teratosphaeria nubilosa]
MAEVLRAASFDNASSSHFEGTAAHISPLPSSSWLSQPRAIFGFVLLLAVVLGQAVRVANKKRLPAGVKALPRLPGLPWAGRFWDVPEAGIDSAWHFGKLHETYGPIYEWKVMGTIHIWIQTDKIARDLLVARQKNYGDRNALPAAIGVREGSEVLPLMGFGDQFKRYKNFMHFILRDGDHKGFYGFPEVENKRTLRRMLETPDRWSEHMLVHAARTISGIAWGDPIHGAKLMTIVPELLKAVSPAGSIVSKLTFLANLPFAINPFWQSEVRRKQEMTDAFCEALDDAERRLKSGDHTTLNWSRLWLEKEKGTEHLDRYEAAHAIGSSSFVGIATIGGPLHAFFLAMCHYPSWQIKVQAEIDRVCGDRPPTFDDMPQLPCLRATIKELLRWRQSTPLGVPHVAMEDDVYEGYLIPKGAILHVSQYLVQREEEQFPLPNEFLPDRWLHPSYPTYKEPLSEFPNLRNDRTFGYGNRSCPGVDLTYHELTTMIGSILWAYTIKRPEGKAGYEHPLPWYETSPWVITMSKPFPCDVQVRSEAKRQYILNECPAGENLVKDSEAERVDRWTVVRKPGEQYYSWDDLAAQASPAHRVYGRSV